MYLIEHLIWIPFTVCLLMILRCLVVYFLGFFHFDFFLMETQLSFQCCLSQSSSCLAIQSQAQNLGNMQLACPCTGQEKVGSLPISHTLLTLVNFKSDRINRCVRTIIAGRIFILYLRPKSLTTYCHGQPMHALDNTFI